ncbi:MULTISPECIES: hypothetical protein [unclassified Polaribacter]|uniref:hypothetical protein n=1 Tax=unclassified Polaribacter TaxID=196858 RepID=UPI001673263C|nr:MULTISPECIES: hypothetical protein [unclassified Polaribacter]
MNTYFQQVPLKDSKQAEEFSLRINKIELTELAILNSANSTVKDKIINASFG